MARSKVKSDARVYQMKVTLRGTEPDIWRRIQVTGDATLADLHIILQIVMGWEDCHLHQFAINRVQYGDPYILEDPEVIDEAEVTLREVFGSTRRKFPYTYDFGDDWEHDILIERILPVTEGAQYPVCVAGENACPPEDCGGVWRFYDKLEIANDPNHPEHEEQEEWLGEDFEPAAFNAKAVNSWLAEITRVGPR